MFSKFRSINLSLIPLIPGTKTPAIPAWTQYCDRLPTIAEAAAWDKGRFGYGLALGPASNLLAIDIDSDDPKILSACKPSQICKRGRKGETRFFRYSAEIPSTRIANCIDILSRGRQTVLPPSIHPETLQPYCWITAATLENCVTSDLPLFSHNDLRSLRSILEGKASGQPVLSHNDWRNLISQSVPEGMRNSRLASIAGGLLRAGLHPKDVFEFLTFFNTRNLRPPLELIEIEGIMFSIMKREYQRRTGRTV